MAFNTNDVKKTIDCTCSANTDGWEILVTDEGCWAKKAGYLVCLESHDLMRGFFLGAEVARLIESDEAGSEVASLKFDIDYSAATEAREELDKLAEAAREVVKVAGELDETFFGLNRKDVNPVGIAELVAELVAESIRGNSVLKGVV